MPSPKAPPVRECRSVTGAARRLGRAHEVLSRAIRAGTLRAWPDADGRHLVWDRDADAWAAQAGPGRPAKVAG